MCGINGFTYNKQVSKHKSILNNMNQALIHRGPDDTGTFACNFAMIGMQRLSVIDLSSGHQPIFNENKTIAIVFNGEIYNYQELRNDLKSKGHIFTTYSDTEALVHLYEQLGTDMVNKLNGMFAFAIIDIQKQTIFFARDHFGIKPLYYHITKENNIIFSSELHSLIQHPNIKRKINYQAMIAYLSYGYVPYPLTMFDGVFQLPPAHTMIWSKNDNCKISQFWSYNIQPDENMTEKKAVEELQYLLTDSIKKQMVSDVPIGAFLSGGIDSSTVAAFASKATDKALKTFTVKFSETNYDESYYAKMVADHIKSKHYEIFIPESAFDPAIIDIIIKHFGQPFGDTSCIPTYLLSKHAREYVTVCLSGDGGDELFAGYDTIKWFSKIIKLKKRSPKLFSKFMLAILNKVKNTPLFAKNTMQRQIRKGLELSLYDERHIFYRLISLFQPEELEQIIIDQRLIKDFLYPVQNIFCSHFSLSKSKDALEDAVLSSLTKISLPGDMLTKVDSMSMASSLEIRVPILDYRIGELSQKIPFHLKAKNGTLKYILRKAGYEYLPKEIYSHKKQGFAIPLYKWFNKNFWDLIEEYTAMPKTHSIQTLFNKKVIKNIIKQGKNACKNEGIISHYSAATRVWMFLLLFRWADYYQVEM